MVAPHIGVIAVQVERGWITLTGQVPWYSQKAPAGPDIARRPVVDVPEISNKIRRALHRSWLLDDEDVTDRGDGGHIHLTGTVHSQHDRQGARATACAGPGPTRVENDIPIR